jgi:small multidrug resistance pump
MKGNHHMSIFMLFGAGTLSAIASILLRIAAQDNGKLVAGALTLASLGSLPMLLRIGALAAYGCGFVLYAVALKRVQLSMAYPLMVGTTVIALIAYDLVAQEGVGVKTAAGAALLMIGVVLIYS